MSYIIPRADTATWEQWASTVTGYNPGWENLLSPEMTWQRFGEQLTLVAPSTPNPYEFESWVEWGNALKWALQG